MTDQVQEIILDENKSKETVEVLKRYTLRAVNEEIPKGWEYWFKIKTKTGEMISVSFLGADALNSTESRVVIDRVMYVLTGYNSDDFLFLFDKEK